MLFVVFPQFYQPLESHLGFVTKTPAIHWFFNGKDITKYNNIIKERGEEDKWYNISSPDLKDWEMLPTLNGTSIKKFTNIINNNNLKVLFKGRDAIFSDGKIA